MTERELAVGVKGLNIQPLVNALNEKGKAIEANSPAAGPAIGNLPQSPGG